MRWISFGWLSLIILSFSSVRAQSRRELTPDYRQRGDSLVPIWSYFGYDEPNYTYQPDEKKVRYHNLLTTGDGSFVLKWGCTNAYTEDDCIYTGWAYPPGDYAKWGEVWNEPNISYWKGAREEYYSLYDHAVDAVKRALPVAHVGGGGASAGHSSPRAEAV